MRSSRRAGLARQQGFGLIEALVGSALLGVALVVLLGTLSGLLVGARTAEGRVVAERIAKNTIERLMAEPFGACLDQRERTVEGTTYLVSPKCIDRGARLVEYRVIVSYSSGGSVSLGVFRSSLQPGVQPSDEEGD